MPERSSRGMRPTALGAVVLERAKAMIKDLDHLAREMEAPSPPAMRPTAHRRDSVHFRQMLSAALAAASAWSGA